jgi:hypothetical protein
LVSVCCSVNPGEAIVVHGEQQEQYMMPKESRRRNRNTRKNPRSRLGKEI